MKLELSKIRIDGGTQSRANLQRNKINEYAELIKEGTELPALDVFYDGENYWLADGFHRYWAKKQLTENTEDGFLPEETIEVTVHQGTQRDAILFSLSANATHGLPRTQEDKNRAVETIIRDSEWTTWSDREIARICKVSNTFVAKCREKLNGSTVNVDSKKSYKRDGKVQTMKTENIGKHKITKEKEAVDTETGEIVIKNEDTRQLEKAIEQEMEDAQRELTEQSNEDAEMPSYNVISEEKKPIELNELNIELYSEQQEIEDLKNQKSALNEEIASLRFQKGQLEKQLEEANKKITALTETNNQLFEANENLTQELKEIKQKNVDLEKDNLGIKLTKKFQHNNKEEIFIYVEELHDYSMRIKEYLGYELDEPMEGVLNLIISDREELREKMVEYNSKLNDIRLINEDVLELRKSNKNLEYQVSRLVEENNTLKESRDRLKLHVKPDIRKDAELMLASLQGIFESCLEKNKEKKEGIRIGKTDSIELLNSIKQARGVE